MKAIGKNIILKPIEPERKSSIITMGKEEVNTGLALSVGSGVKQIKKGDVVIFNKQHAHDIKIGEVGCIAIEEDSCYGTKA